MVSACLATTVRGVLARWSCRALCADSAAAVLAPLVAALLCAAFCGVVPGGRPPCPEVEDLPPGVGVDAGCPFVVPVGSELSGPKRPAPVGAGVAVTINAPGVIGEVLPGKTVWAA